MIQVWELCVFLQSVDDVTLNLTNVGLRTQTGHFACASDGPYEGTAEVQHFLFSR